MADWHSNSNEMKRRKIVEKMWLTYFNTFVFERNLISQTQYERMKVIINGREPKEM